METAKEISIRYLQSQRDAVLWKLDGVSEYDARRPLVPSGTNLLGLVKHLAWCELDYFVTTFGGELPVPDLFAQEGADPHDDLWVPAEESREDVVGLYRTAWELAGRTFATHELDHTVQVAHWPVERATATLHQLLVHMAVETARHAGHLDILREHLDGAIGLRPTVSNLPDDGYDWDAYLARVQASADTFR